MKYDNIEQELNDILLGLRDDGLTGKVEFVKDYGWYIFVSLLDYTNKKTVHWDDLKEEVFRMTEYLKDTFEPNLVYYKQVRNDGRIFNKNNRDSSSYEEFIKMMENPDNNKYIGLFESKNFIFLSFIYKELR